MLSVNPNIPAVRRIITAATNKDIRRVLIEATGKTFLNDNCQVIKLDYMSNVPLGYIAQQYPIPPTKLYDIPVDVIVVEIEGNTATIYCQKGAINLSEPEIIDLTTEQKIFLAIIVEINWEARRRVAKSLGINYDKIKEELQDMKLLLASGAITPKGRNALGSETLECIIRNELSTES